MASSRSQPIELTGMTWSHPRGYSPLRALASLAREEGPLRVNGSTVRWDHQDLAGFESRSIAQLALQYDLLVLDHPGLGNAIAAGALVPLDEVLEADELASWQSLYVGDAADAYRVDGHHWAVPIDAATQVGAYRPDLLEHPPRVWADVLELARTTPFCVPTKAPHTLLTFLGIAASIEPGFVPTDEELVSPELGAAAFDTLRELVNRLPEELLDLDPIEVLELVSVRDVALCPLLYGYVNYARPSGGASTVLFTNAPRWRADGPPGSVLGGTGLAISRNSIHRSAAIDHLRQISSERAQLTVVPQAGGQPSAASAWSNARIDEDWNGFYGATLETQLSAWRRPRYDGWIRLQHEGSVALFEAISAGRTSSRAISKLNRLYRDSRRSRD